MVEELKTVADMGFPIAALGLVGFLKNMVQVASMGRLGRLELAGGALAVGFTNITGYSVLSGLAMGMEPLCSQGFGSRNPGLAVLSLHRTTLLLLAAALPIGLLWAGLEPILLGLRQDPDTTRVAGLYCRVAIPDLVAHSLLLPLRIYLRSKGEPWPVMWCTLIATLLHLPITAILAFALSLGVPGIAVSAFVTNFNTVFLLAAYVHYSREPEEPAPINLALLPLHSSPADHKSLGGGWRTLLSLAVPSCVSVCLEWWWYELMTLLAGYLSDPQTVLAASAIVIQTTSLLYTLPMALSATVSTRVGNELGAGRPGKARLATTVAIGLAFVSPALGLAWTTLGTEAWGRVFTEDERVLRLTRVVLPLIGACEVANCPQTTSCGVLRGTARAGIGAGINFCSFYLVGAPVGILLGFVWGLGFVGLCYGLLAAQVACAVSSLMVVCMTDWERECSKSKELVGKGGGDDALFAHARDGDQATKFQGVGLLKEVDSCKV